MLCDKAHKATTEKFFGSVNEDDDGEIIEINPDKLDQLGHLAPTYGTHLNQEKAKQMPVTSMNQLTFDLSRYGAELVGKHFEIQIELLDSFRRLHKSAPISQVLITPEFYGHLAPEEPPLEMNVESDAHGENLVNLVVVPQGKEQEARRDFLISRQAREKLQVLGNSKINGVDYKIYSGLPDNKHIENNKLFEMQSAEQSPEVSVKEGSPAESAADSISSPDIGGQSAAI